MGYAGVWTVFYCYPRTGHRTKVRPLTLCNIARVLLSAVGRSGDRMSGRQQPTQAPPHVDKGRSGDGVQWGRSLRTRIALWAGLVNVVLLLLLALTAAWFGRRAIEEDARLDTR